MSDLLQNQSTTSSPLPDGEATLDQANPTPLYYQIYLLYKQKIMTGSIAHGDRLPSEAELAAKHNVSRITAKRSMNELANEGLVTRSRGKGTTVSYLMPVSDFSVDFSGLMENLIAIGTSTDVDVLSFDYVHAPPPIADALRLEPGALVQRAERRRSRDGKPFSHILSYLPEDIGRSFERDDLTDKPILSLIERAGHPIQEANQSVTAVLADPIFSSVLKVQQGSPLIKVTRVVLDQTSRPVQYIEVVYRPDVYQLNMSLRRVKGKEPGSNMWNTEKAHTPD
ncbi:MAG: GntR family transcriptional regulator [Hyphomicrobiales bacterium]